MWSYPKDQTDDCKNCGTVMNHDDDRKAAEAAKVAQTKRDLDANNVTVDEAGRKD